MDIMKITFCQNDLENKVFMVQPTRFSNPEGDSILNKEELRLYKKFDAFKKSKCFLLQL